MAAVTYVYGVQDLYALAPFATMGLHTSVALVLLSLGALLVDPERGWAATVASDYLGGGAARRQLLFTLSIPIAGAVLLWATNAREVGPNLAMALLVVLTAASLCRPDPARCRKPECPGCRTAGPDRDPRRSKGRRRRPAPGTDRGACGRDA